MNAAISSDGKESPSSLLEKIRNQPSMTGLNLTGEVTTKKTYKWDLSTAVEFDKRLGKSQKIPFKVVAIDFGIKRSILNRLVSYGCEVQVLPADANYSDVMQFEPEGVFLSNGPGDPSAVKEGMKRFA